MKKKKRQIQRHFPLMKWLKEKEYSLPNFYDRDNLVLLLQDPFWLYVYWDLSLVTQTKVKEHLKRLVLRVNDVTDIIFTGNNAISYWDIPINTYTDNWYVKVQNNQRNYLVELGYYQEGKFMSLLCSNALFTPLDRLLPVLDRNVYNVYWQQTEEQIIAEEYGELQKMIDENLLPLSKKEDSLWVYRQTESSPGYWG